MNKKNYIFLLLIFSVATVISVPLENWRTPFYNMAVEQNEITGSPSGMFWDDMLHAHIMDSSLWPDSARFAENHWTLEPAFISTFSNDTFVTGNNENVHFDLLSNFHYKALTVRTALDVDQSYKSDPDFVWKDERIAAGLIEEAYLQYTGNYGFARLGRLKRNWGPFYNRSILLSNNPYPYDAFEWQLHTSFLEFRHLFAAFPRRYSNKDTSVDTNNTGSRQNRYLTAHALNFIFRKWASVGISEIALFSRESGFPDMQYINPFSIYSVINTNTEGPANLLLGLQGWVHPFTPKINIKAQVVFDDFQVDNEDPLDQEPTHWACDFGLYWIDLLPIRLNHHISLEYRYLSKWMYTVTKGNTIKGERYTYLGRSLGNHDIDGDFFKGSFTAVGKNFWAASFGMSLGRQDTNTVSTPWPIDTLGYRNEKPLSERSHLKTTLSAFIEAHGYFRNFCGLHLNFENSWIKHKHKKNEYKYNPRISLTISLHYCDFFIPFRVN